MPKRKPAKDFDSLRHMPEGAEIVPDEEVEELLNWLKIDGPKGDWASWLGAASFARIPIDELHQRIFRLIRKRLHDDSFDAIEEYLFTVHGILPGDSITLAELERLLKADLRAIRIAARKPPLVLDEPPATAKATESSRKPKGRPKADYDTVESEANLARQWEQARESGTQKTDFAKQIEMRLSEFNKLLGRVAARKKRSDK